MLAICNCSSEGGSKMEKVSWQIALPPSGALHCNELARVPEAAMPYLCCEKCKVLRPGKRPLLVSTLAVLELLQYHTSHCIQKNFLISISA